MSLDLTVYRPPATVERLSSRQVIAAVGLSESSAISLTLIAASGPVTTRSVSEDAKRLQDRLRDILPPATYAMVGKLISQEVSMRVWKSKHPEAADAVDPERTERRRPKKSGNATKDRVLDILHQWDEESVPLT